MKHVIDTNCLLSFVTDRNLEQNRRMAAVFERASRLEEEIVLVSNVISEFVYVQLSVYGQKERLVSDMIADLMNHPGVQYHHGFFPQTILSLWPGSMATSGTRSSRLPRRRWKSRCTPSIMSSVVAWSALPYPSMFRGDRISLCFRLTNAIIRVNGPDEPIEPRASQAPPSGAVGAGGVAGRRLRKLRTIAG